MKVETIRELTPSDNWRGKVVLVKKGEDYFAISSVNVPYSGFETLVFRATKEGTVIDWGEVAGGKGVSREEAIRQLEDE